MPSVYPPGFSESCKSKVISNSLTDRQALVRMLKDWMGQCASRGRESELVDANQSVDGLWNELMRETGAS